MKIGQPCPQPPNGWSVILWLHQTENRKFFFFLFSWVSAAYMFILTAVGRKNVPTWYLTFYHLCWAQVVQHSSLSDSVLWYCKDNWIILKDLSFLVCFWYTLDCASYLLSGFYSRQGNYGMWAECPHPSRLNVGQRYRTVMLRGINHVKDIFYLNMTFPTPIKFILMS